MSLAVSDSGVNDDDEEVAVETFDSSLSISFRFMLTGGEEVLTWSSGVGERCRGAMLLNNDSCNVLMLFCLFSMDLCRRTGALVLSTVNEASLVAFCICLGLCNAAQMPSLGWQQERAHE